MEHFKNPRNMGELEDADAVGEVGNPTCGDLMYIYIKVKDDKINDISFQTFGCGAAIATSSMVTELAKGKTLDEAMDITREDVAESLDGSMVTELAKGKTLDEAMDITREDVAESLDGLPPVKMHCSNLAADSLHDAIKKYREKQEA